MKSSDIEKVETILTKIECLKKEISFLNLNAEFKLAFTQRL